MTFNINNKLSFPSYSEIIYLDELIRAALMQDNTEEFCGLTENLKTSKRSILSNKIKKQLLTVISLTDSPEKLSAFFDYTQKTDFSLDACFDSRTDYSRPIIDSLIISIVRNDLETARQLLSDRSNTFMYAVPMYYIMLTKNYSLIPDCLECIKRSLESPFYDAFHKRPFEDELAYVIASAAVHRDSEFLTRLFENGYEPSVLAAAFLTNRPDSFDFLANTYFAYIGKSEKPSEFVRTIFTPEYQLNFVLCTALLSGRDNIKELLSQYSLPEKATAILSSDIRFLEGQQYYKSGSIKESVKSILDNELTIVIDDNYTYFALYNSITEGHNITLDLRHYNNNFDDVLFRMGTLLPDLVSHKLIFEQSEECPRFIREVLKYDSSGSYTRLFIENGVINNDNISAVKKYAEENDLTAPSAALKEYLNEQ